MTRLAKAEQSLGIRAIQVPLFFSQSKAEHIAVVAHSFGGIVTLELAQKFFSDFEARVFAAMLTDSVHHLRPDENSDFVRFMQSIGVNFVASDEKLGTRIRSKYSAIKMVSAGHQVHEWTSTACKDLLFNVIQKRLRKREQESPENENEGSNPTAPSGEEKI